MRILFDHNTPLPLRQSLQTHEIATTAEHGWDRIANGKLLDAAEAFGFDILLTADKGFRHQQNLTHRRIAVVVLSRGNWPDVKMNITKIVDAVKTCSRERAPSLSLPRPLSQTSSELFPAKPGRGDSFHNRTSPDILKTYSLALHAGYVAGR